MQSEGLTVAMRDGVRILTLANPPSNALTPALRARLIAEIGAVGPEYRRIVIAGAGVTFSGALPLDPDPDAPALAELCAAVEDCPVPVVIALHGLVTGPGAELALAARGRIAAPGTRIAWPDVALGLCPEGGSTLRLARLAGIRATLGILLTGRAIPAEEARALGLIDAVAADPLTAALTVSLSAGVHRPVVADPVALAEVRRSRPQIQPAPGRIVACVEAAALLPQGAHRAFEAVAREDLEASPEAAALRSAAWAERRAVMLPPALARQRPAVPDRIALSGKGAGLVTLARMALAQGVRVAWHHPDAPACADNLAALAAAEAAEQRAGRLTAAARAAGQELLHEGGGGLEVLQIHDRPQNWRSPPLPDSGGVAHLVLGGVEGGFGLALTPQGRLCELALPPDMAAATSAMVIAGLRRIGLQPLLVGGRPILGESLVTVGRVALAQLARSGVPAATIHAALEGFGVRRPETLPNPETLPHPEVDPPQAMEPGEVLSRWLAALANEGLRLVDQGIALRPSDIDLVLVANHGFPRGKGGPMHLADRRGLMLLRHDLRLWAKADPVWAPAQLLDRLIRDGLRLADLDRRV